MSQHLGQNPKSNALRRNLLRVGIEADTCLSFSLTAYGPILPEQDDMANHSPSRDKMEGLRDALHGAGYQVLNNVQSRHPIDKGLMKEILTAFAFAFPRLGATE